MSASGFTLASATVLALLALPPGWQLAAAARGGHRQQPSDGEWVALTPPSFFVCTRAHPVIVPSRQLVLAFLTGPECSGARLGGSTFGPGAATVPVEGDQGDGSPVGSVFDSARDRVLCFFGHWDGARLTELTTYALRLGDTLRWERLETVGSAPVAWGSLVLDSRHDRVVMFGGMTLSEPWIETNEVWSLSLVDLRWTRLTPGGPEPTGRFGHSAVYDPDRNRMLVFGGTALSGTSYADIWALSLGNQPRWSRIESDGESPPARWLHGAIYDSRARRMLICGGVEGAGGIGGPYTLLQVWELSLLGRPTWQMLDPGSTPQYGRGLTAAYDPDRDRMLIGNLGNLWSLEWDWGDRHASPRRDIGLTASQGSTPPPDLADPIAQGTANEGVEVRLYDIAGRLVFARNVADPAAWLNALRTGAAREAAGLAPGVYFAQRRDRAGPVSGTRIVLLKH